MKNSSRPKTSFPTHRNCYIKTEEELLKQYCKTTFIPRGLEFSDFLPLDVLFIKSDIVFPRKHMRNLPVSLKVMFVWLHCPSSFSLPSYPLPDRARLKLFKITPTTKNDDHLFNFFLIVTKMQLPFYYFREYEHENNTHE